MAFKFKNPWSGGALGKLGDAIIAIQYALDHVKGENRIIVEKHSDGSFTVKYGGPIARNGWNGKIYRAGTQAPLVDVDVKNPANILGEYVCVNVDTWSWEWADEEKEDAGWSSFHVAEPWDDPNGDLPDTFGSYALTADFNGSIVIGGGGGGWSGKIFSHDGSLIMSVDVSDSSNIQNAYVVYDGESKEIAWASTARGGLYSWHVADSDENGGFILSPATQGDIVLPVPDSWDERQILQTGVETEGAFPIFADLKITADKAGEQTGFVFEKPEDEEYGLSQMKPDGIGEIPENGVLALCAKDTQSAEWKEIKDWPENSKIKLMTNIKSVEFDVSGNTLTLRIKYGQVEIDFNEKTIGEEEEAYTDPAVVIGTEC